MRKQAKELTVKPGSHRVVASIVHERTGASVVDLAPPLF